MLHGPSADGERQRADRRCLARPGRHPPHRGRRPARKFGKPRSTRIDRRTTRHPGYAASQKLRKRIEEGLGWIKTTGGLAKTRHRGLDRVGWMFTFTAAAYNLVRLPKLLAEAPT